MSDIKKLLLMGDEEVGKQEILQSLRFHEDSTVPASIKNYGLDYKTRSVEIDGKQATFRFCFMSGKNSLKKIKRIDNFPEYSTFIGILLVYNVASEKSFNSVRKWLRKLKRTYGDIPIVTMGYNCNSPNRKVSMTEGKQHAELNEVSYFETDINNEDSIEEAFLNLARFVLVKYPLKENHSNHHNHYHNEHNNSCLLDNRPTKLDTYGFEVPFHLVEEYTKYLNNMKRFEPFFKKDFSVSQNTSKEKLRALVITGIPKDKRAKFWMISSGAMKKKINADLNSSNGNYYEVLKYKIKKPLSSRRSQIVTSEIQKDLERAYPNHPYIKLGELERVLLCFARRNKSIGYCQGLNFIASWLLIHLQSEEDAFWMLTTIAEDICPGFWSETMVSIQLNNLAVKDILKKRNPTLFTQLTQYELSIEVVSIKWFICLFLNALPSETTVRLWDLFLIDGPIVLFKSFIHIMHLCEKEFTDAADSIEICQIIQNKASCQFDAEKYLHAILKMTEINDEKINSLKESLSSTLVIDKRDFTDDSDTNILSSPRAIHFRRKDQQRNQDLVDVTRSPRQQHIFPKTTS